MFHSIEIRWHSTSPNATLRYCAVVQIVIVRFQTYYGYLWKNLPSLRMSRPVLFTCSYAASFCVFVSCYLLTNLCQFTRTTFSWTTTGGMTGFPRTDKRVASDSFFPLTEVTEYCGSNDTSCLRNVLKTCLTIYKHQGGHIKQTVEIKSLFLLREFWPSAKWHRVASGVNISRRFKKKSWF